MTEGQYRLMAMEQASIMALFCVVTMCSCVGMSFVCGCIGGFGAANVIKMESVKQIRL